MLHYIIYIRSSNHINTIIYAIYTSYVIYNTLYYLYRNSSEHNLMYIQSIHNIQIYYYIP